MKTVVRTLSMFLGACFTLPAMAAGWQPLRPIELIVPAGAEGGADQMARTIQEIIAKHRLAPRPIVVVNKFGDSGAEGFRLIKSNRRNNHQLIVTLSNLFTLSHAANADFNWQELTPVCLLALDQFVLWVRTDSPYRSASEYIDAVRAAPEQFRMGGTGSGQEDEIITKAIERAVGVKFRYVPHRGGGDVARALANQYIDSSLNNPIEALTLWRLGKIRPLGVFDSRTMEFDETIAGEFAWRSIPTMKEQNIRVEYLMPRGIFAAPDIADEVRDYYADLMRRVTRTPEWQTYLRKAALKEKFLVGGSLNSWLTFTDAAHQALVTE